MHNKGTSTMTRIFFALFALLMTVATASAQTATAPPPPKIPAIAAAHPGDIHLALGNPSQATHDVDNPDPTNFLMMKPQFALSYNNKRGTPNWVSYYLKRVDMGR